MTSERSTTEAMHHLRFVTTVAERRVDCLGIITSLATRSLLGIIL